VIYGETWGQASSSWRKWYTEETANPMSLPVPVHHVDSGFRRNNLWRCLKRRRPRDAGREITKRSHQVLCFQREDEKKCSRRIASFAISFSTASAVAEGADYEAFAFCTPIILRDSSSCARKCLRFRICVGFAAAWLQPMRPSFTLPWLFERNSIPSPKFVQADCTATANRIPPPVLLAMKV